MIQATLCFVFEDHSPRRILLGYKKRGFGVGKYYGFGGKVMDGESPVDAAVRELREESGIHVRSSDLVPMGVLTFIFPNQPAWDQEVHVFTACSWQGVPVESEEMRPQWYPLDGIPYGQMWDDTHYWLPHILDGKPIGAVFTFDQNNELVCAYKIQQL